MNIENENFLEFIKVMAEIVREELSHNHDSEE
jgi:hypothetical protein